MKSLRELYTEHKGKLSDKWSIYFDLYDRFFIGWRSKPVALLEIGIQNGGSLEIWARYFEFGKNFVGCDINPDCARLAYADPRIAVIVGDANTDVAESAIATNCERFNIIIDDGSHKSSDIVRSFLRYWPRLQEGGIFVIEDLHCSYWDAYEGGIHYPWSSISFLKLLVDLVNHEHWGVPSARMDLVRGFLSQYEFDISENELAEIQTITFANSLCFITKEPPAHNSLGARTVVGVDESVIGGLRLLNGSVQVSPNQIANPYSAEITPPAEALESVRRDLKNVELSIASAVAERETRLASLAAALEERENQLDSLHRRLRERESQLASLRSDIAERDARIANQMQAAEVRDRQLVELNQTISEIHSSTSWKISAPVRWVGAGVRALPDIRTPLRKVVLGTRAAVHLLQTASLPHLATRAVKVLLQEGPGGITARLRRRHHIIAAAGAHPLTPIFPRGEPGPSLVRNRHHGRYALDQASPAYVYVEPQPPDHLDERIAALSARPRFSIVVPVYNTPTDLLNAAVGSVLAQWYPEWELILVDDASPSEETQTALAKINHPKIRLLRQEKNEGIAGATNAGLDAAEGDFIVFMDHDDELTVDCLYELALCIDQEQPDFIYSDEDKLDERGDYVQPHFKPDWSPDTMMSTMFTCHVSCVRRDLLSHVGGLRSEYNGCQDWDFVLRVSEHTERISHVPKVLYHWRIIPESTASDIAAKPYVLEASRRTRMDALQRRGLIGNVEPVHQVNGYFRVKYEMRDDPLVSIIIPSRDNYTVLKRCVNSIFEKSSYRKFEIIILDNGSTQAETLDYLEHVSRVSQLTVIRHDEPFNFSELNNIGAARASGDLLLFLNDDTEVLTNDWIERMGGYAQLAHVGAVGAKLLYPGGHGIQHVGVLNLINGPVHAFAKHDADAPGYFMRNLLEYNWLAVTGACLMMEAHKFKTLGGFDESFPVAYNDVELCFRAVENGLFNVVVPAATLIHYESLSRGLDHADPAKHKRLMADLRRLYDVHPRFFQYDPFHNPNLHPSGLNFEVAC